MNIPNRFKLWPVAAVAPLVVLLAGCPRPGTGIDPQIEYDAGFAVGFAQDSEYWDGFDDSYFTVDGGEILYDGDLIPELDEVSYDAGYYDGLWYAYNDGYFVAYDYAFTIGFSEGYDLAFGPNWESFLLNDIHVEWLDGGFTDGYNDGFSEGRILGASDWIDGLAFDWLDAMIWYRESPENDVYLESVDLGTGEFGPVVLYEYGTNPHELVKGIRSKSARKSRGPVPAIRQDRASTKQDFDDGISYRPLIEDVQSRLDVRPTDTPRATEKITLETTWLERVNAYNAAFSKESSQARIPSQK